MDLKIPSCKLKEAIKHLKDAWEEISTLEKAPTIKALKMLTEAEPEVY